MSLSEHVVYIDKAKSKNLSINSMVILSLDGGRAIMSTPEMMQSSVPLQMAELPPHSSCDGHPLLYHVLPR